MCLMLAFNLKYIQTKNMFKALILISVSFISVLINATTVIHAGYLFVTEKGNLEPEISIIVDNDKIVDVIEGYVAPDPDDKYIDLTGYYILPGLIDMHVHLTNRSSNRAT